MKKKEKYIRSPIKMINIEETERVKLKEVLIITILFAVVFSIFIYALGKC